MGKSKQRYVATTDSKNSELIAPNLLNRNFEASRPNEVWVTDVTAIWTWEGWVYLAAIIDLFGRRVVGWDYRLRLRDKPQIRDEALDGPLSGLQRFATRPGVLSGRSAFRGTNFCAYMSQTTSGYDDSERVDSCP